MIRGDKEWYIFLAGKRWKLLSATLSNPQSYNLRVTLISKSYFITFSMSISPSRTSFPPYQNATALAMNMNASDKPNEAPWRWARFKACLLIHKLN